MRKFSGELEKQLEQLRCAFNNFKIHHEDFLSNNDRETNNLKAGLGKTLEEKALRINQLETSFRVEIDSNKEVRCFRYVNNALLINVTESLRYRASAASRIKSNESHKLCKISK